MVFRWSIWGEEVVLGCEVLRRSLGTFRGYFGPSARYVVCTDHPEAITRLFDGTVTVIRMEGWLSEVASHTIWQKWSPAIRLFPDETEIYVDIDVFIVGDAHELRSFGENRSEARFLAMPEAVPDPILYGAFRTRIPEEVPQINAGLVGQRAGSDLTEDFGREFAWWRSQVAGGPGRFPDEQGAVAASLLPYARSGQLCLLPASRYKIVSPRSNPALSDLSGVALIHATQRGHPALAWFDEAIGNIPR